jgi:hypothetical protein
MKEAISRNDGRRSSRVAIVAILAMLIAPFCGPLCAANACAGSGASGRANTVDCHHRATADKTDGLQTQVVPVKACNAAELPAATLTATKSWSSLSETRRAAAPQFHSIASKQHSRFSLGVSHARWRQHNSAARANDKATNTIVLRI